MPSPDGSVDPSVASSHDALPGRRASDAGSAFASERHPAFDPLDPSNWPEIEGLVISAYLGGGGFGHVYKATATALGGEVAIKILKPRFSADLEAVRRFEREVQTAHQNRHSHVVQVLSTGTCLTAPFQDCRYVVTEFLVGGDLRCWLGKTPLNTVEGTRAAVEKIVAACRGLAAIHAAGVVHRDIKPENILLDAAGEAKLGDFGLAAFLAREARDNLTATGQMVGTLPYCAPEQILDPRKVTPQSDLYAVGIIIYEVLCGLRPWQEGPRDDREQDRILSNLHSLPPQPSSKVRAANRRLQQICLRCLDPDPRIRYADAEQLRESLDAWLDGEPDPHAVGGLRRLFQASILRPICQKPLRASVALSLLLVLILACGGAAFWWFAYHHPRVEYYADYVESLYGPIGVGRLSEREARQRYQSLRISRNGWYGNPRKLALIDASLNLHYASHIEPIIKLADREQDAVRFSYEYDDNGWINQETASAFDGTTCWRLQYTHQELLGSRLHFASFQKLISRPAGDPMNDPQRIQAAEGKFVGSPPDADAGGGPVTAFLGKRAAGELRAAAVGAKGQRGTMRNRRSVSVVPSVQSATGVTDFSFECDEMGITRKFLFLNAAGRPARRDDGAFGELQVDVDGDLLGDERWLLDSDGAPAPRSDGVMRITVCRDPVTRYTTATQYYGPDSQLTDNEDGYAVEVVEFDNDGFPTGTRLLDSDAKVANHAANHFAITRFTFSGRRLRRVEWRDRDGQPLHLKETAAYVEYQVDDASGRLSSITHGGFDASEDNVHAMRTTYDEAGRIREVRNLDSIGNPAVHSESDVAGWTVEYSADRNTETLIYRDTNWSETQHADGNSRFVTAYLDGSPVGRTYTGYDDSVDGVAAMHESLDDRGRVVETRYLDSDLSPVQHKVAKIAGWTFEYREAPRSETQIFRDQQGKRVAGANRVSAIRTVYDDRNRVASVEYLDTSDDRAVSTDDDTAGWTAQFSPDGLTETRTNRDVDWEATRHKDGNVDIVIVTADGRVVSRTPRGYDIETKGYAARRVEYSEDGMSETVVFFDDQGAETPFPVGGYRRLTHTTNGTHIIAVASGLDRDDGVVSYRVALDETNDETYTPQYVRYLDAAGDLVESTKEGVAGWDLEYSDDGRTTTWKYVDCNGDFTAHADGNRERVVVTDGEAEVEKLWTGYDVAKTGYFTKKHVLNDKQDVVEEWYLDSEGDLMLHTLEGIAGWKIETDSASGTTQQSFYDAHGNRAVHNQGYASFKSTFVDGVVATREYLGLQDEPLQVRTFAVRILPESNASTAGIAQGDVLAAYDGIPVETMATIINITGRPLPGDVDPESMVELRVIRNGEPQVFEVRRGLLGIVLQDVVAGFEPILP